VATVARLCGIRTTTVDNPRRFFEAQAGY